MLSNFEASATGNICCEKADKFIKSQKDAVRCLQEIMGNSDNKIKDFAGHPFIICKRILTIRLCSDLIVMNLFVSFTA